MHEFACLIPAFLSTLLVNERAESWVCMKRLDEILGLPVILKQSGLKVGTVSGACLAQSGKAIAGLMIEKNHWRGKGGFLPMNGTGLIGDVSVIAEGMNSHPKALTPLTLGQRVVSIDGQRLGLLTNAMIDVETGEITAVEVSRGLIDDWTSGRLWVRSFQNSSSQTVVDVESDSEYLDKEDPT